MLVVMVIGLILSRSRMGNGAFFNSLLITGLIALLFSPSFRQPGVYGLLLSIIIIDIFLLGSWFGLEKVVQRMEQTTLVSESSLRDCSESASDDWLLRLDWNRRGNVLLCIPKL